MPGLLFLPQSLLDAWLGDAKVDIEAEGLRVLEEARTFGIEPACRFLRLIEGADDAGLLSRVKTEQELRDLGAEVFGDSVVIGEVAYEVVPGFVAIVEGPLAATGAGAAATPATRPATASAPDKAAAAPRPKPSTPAPAARSPADEKREKKEEADLLSRFLLEKLN